MAYKSISLVVFINLFLIILTSAPLIFLITGPHYYFVAYLIPLLIIEVFTVLKQIDHTNRSINYFFEAVENDDSSLSFPVDVKNKELKKIHGRLNKVNRIIQDIKTKNIAKEKFYLNLIQHSATGLIAINPEGKIILMNQKAYYYMGIPPYLSPDMLKIKNAGFYTILEGVKGGETVLNKFKFGDKLCYLSIRSAEMRMEDGTYKLISLQDIRQELDEQELESWIKLIRILTHEIMNSIAPITSLSDTLKRYFKKDHDNLKPENITAHVINNTVEGLEVIEERGKGLLDFVNSFRKLTKIPQPVIKPVNVEWWIGQLKILFRQPVADNYISLEIITDSKVTELDMDEKLLTQVIINIFNNAVDALKEKENNRKITFNILMGESNRPTIIISNNGNRIPEDILDKIFIPFFTTKENGSGIGLSLSRQIIRQHGGHLYAESGEEATTFIIEL